MRMILCAAVVLGTTGTAFSKPRYQFPYQAVVEGTGVYARSGPGRNYYSTAKLKAGTGVTVHRHDPGGWYMIAPPKGSFSWIRAEYVRNDGVGRGTLTTNNVIVRVGSEFGNDRDIEQVRLSTGDTVAILAEKSFTTRSGTIRMYQIVPPRGEYRWVRGRHLVPVDKQARRVNDDDPYAIPTHANRKVVTRKELGHPIDADGPKLTAPGTTFGNRGTDAHFGGYSDERTKLTALDKRFRDMVEQNTASWDFATIQAEYTKLRSTCRHPLIKSRIDRRLPTIAHYRSVQAEYQKMMQLSYETERRDAELAGRPVDPQITSPTSNGPTLAGPTLNPPTATLPAPGSQPPPRHQPPVQLSPPLPHGFKQQPTTPATRYPQPQIPTQRQIPTRRPAPRFDGAGIIKRVRQVRPGLPRYAIVAPDGRFLAYLQPVRGLRLERYVGRPMGVYGRRAYRRDLRGDTITVRAMQPVRLLP